MIVKSFISITWFLPGSTSIPHDSESPMDVGHCADPGCYSRPINYNATANKWQRWPNCLMNATSPSEYIWLNFTGIFKINSFYLIPVRLHLCSVWAQRHRLWLVEWQGWECKIFLVGWQHKHSHLPMRHRSKLRRIYWQMQLWFCCAITIIWQW